MYWHNHVWTQSCIGTIESGYSLVVTFMWAQSCIIATYPTNFTSLFWYEMLVYYIFHIFQSQVFFQINNISLKSVWLGGINQEIR